MAMSKRNRERKNARWLERESRRTPLTVVTMSQTQVNWQQHGKKLPPRECGECTACCEAIGVDALGKPPNCRCEHQTNSGCGCYESRPDDCRYWFCCWRLGWGNDADRPDKSGVLLTIQGSTKENISLDVIELKPDALTERFKKSVNGRVVVDLTELIDMLPEHSPWRVDIIRYGVPRPSGGEVAEKYQYASNGPGRDYLIGQLPVGFVIGFIDLEGNLHSQNSCTTNRQEFEQSLQSNEWRKQQLKQLGIGL
jgi:hypothetical protein